MTSILVVGESPSCASETQKHVQFNEDLNKYFLFPSPKRIQKGSKEYRLRVKKTIQSLDTPAPQVNHFLDLLVYYKFNFNANPKDKTKPFYNDMCPQHAFGYDFKNLTPLRLERMMRHDLQESGISEKTLISALISDAPKHIDLWKSHRFLFCQENNFHCGQEFHALVYHLHEDPVRLFHMLSGEKIPDDLFSRHTFGGALCSYPGSLKEWQKIAKSIDTSLSIEKTIIFTTGNLRKLDSKRNFAKISVMIHATKYAKEEIKEIPDSNVQDEEVYIGTFDIGWN